MPQSIWHYVQEAAASAGIGIPVSEAPFNSQCISPRSNLCMAECDNRMLLFPGSFQPPHAGHLALLSCVSSTLLDCLNIRGIIVFPHDDKGNSETTRSYMGAVKLSKEQRIHLWRSSKGIPENDVWLFRHDRASLSTLQRRLQRGLRYNNIKLTFILLLGPDWVRTKAIYDPGQWGCSETITCDISRSADFRCEYTLRQLSGCSPWSVQLGTELQQRCIVQDNAGQYCDTNAWMLCLFLNLTEADEERCPTKSHDNLLILWSCTTLRRPVCQIFFLSCRREASDLEFPPPSSTEIRQKVSNANAHLSVLDEQLLEPALSRTLLLEYLKESGTGENEVRTTCAASSST